MLRNDVQSGEIFQSDDSSRFECKPRVTFRAKSCCIMHFVGSVNHKNPSLSDLISKGRIFRIVGSNEDGDSEFCGFIFDQASVVKADAKLREW